jgi:hypothetical protein
VTLINAAPWSAASREVRAGLRGLAEVQHEYAPGSTLVIDGHDVYRGAYTWRNGLVAATRLAGLRSDLQFTLGTSARLQPEQRRRLGSSVFVVEIDADAGVLDWTACEAGLARGEGGELGSLRLRSERGTLIDSEWLQLAGEPGVIAVRFDARPRESEAVLAGALLWRFEPGRSFNRTDARDFLLAPPESVAVRLRRFEATAPALQIRLEPDGPARAAALSLPLDATLLRGPAACQRRAR